MKLCNKCKERPRVAYSKVYCLPCINAYNKSYRSKNKEKVKVWDRTARQKRDRDPELWRKKIDKDAEYLLKARLETMDTLGGRKCRQCGFSDIRALQIDHVEGGGVQELRIISSRQSYYKKVRANPHLYQILCANCNWIKKSTNKEYGKKFIISESVDS